MTLLFIGTKFIYLGSQLEFLVHVNAATDVSLPKFICQSFFVTFFLKDLPCMKAEVLVNIFFVAVCVRKKFCSCE